MSKILGGRFKNKSEYWLDEFGASISFDYQLAQQDIKGNKAHVRMLATTGIISNKEMQTIISGLESIEQDIFEGRFEYSLDLEDIHMNIEANLHDLIGPVAGKLHTARSRNDQVATDLHLYVKEKTIATIDVIDKLIYSLVKVSRNNKDVLMPGMTHLQHAQPILFAHHLLAYVQMFKRDKERLEDSLKRTDMSPLGSAALAGTTFPIDRFQTAKELDFSKLYENSLDGVSDRDFVIECLSNLSLIMMHLSRLSEEIIIWGAFEFQFIELSDAYSTGSSIMPQKKNSDYAELIRGKTGRVYGYLMGMLTTMKGLPLAYNKDLQEDKEGIFDGFKTVIDSAKVMSGMFNNMKIKKENMKKSVESDFSNATELADYLATLGMPFREAYEIVGKLILSCIDRNIYLSDISLSEYQSIYPKITDEIYFLLQPLTAINRRTSYGGTSLTEVERQLAEWD